MKTTFTLNGADRTFECAPHESLRTVLRREGLFSVRFGAETGEAGSAAVLCDGRLVSAEIMLAAQADGHSIETIEGLNLPRGLHPIQQAFVDTGAIQSGYSTPATILAAKALIDRNPNPTEAEVRDELSGILSAKITAAVDLDDVQQQEIATSLEKQTGKQVAVSVQVDPRLIGGVRAEIGGRLFDGSVKTQLKRIEESLMKG